MYIIMYVVVKKKKKRISVKMTVHLIIAYESQCTCLYQDLQAWFC